MCPISKRWTHQLSMQANLILMYFMCRSSISVSFITDSSYLLIRPNYIIFFNMFDSSLSDLLLSFRKIYDLLRLPRLTSSISSVIPFFFRWILASVR